LWFCGPDVRGCGMTCYDMMFSDSMERVCSRLTVSEVVPKKIMCVCMEYGVLDGLQKGTK
jgi:hypothetical protein